MYTIPEHPAEDVPVKSGPDSLKIQATRDLSVSCKESQLPSPQPSSAQIMANDNIDIAEIKTPPRQIKSGLSVSLIDFRQHGLMADSGSFEIDKEGLSCGNRAQEGTNALNDSGSYLQVPDYTSESSPEYEILQRQNEVSDYPCSALENSAGHRPSDEKGCSSKVSDLNPANRDGSSRSTEDVGCGVPSDLRQRSGSFQWVQNAFQSVGQKFSGLRRPSDVAEERVRKSQEDMDQHHYCIPSDLTTAGRRFSENVINRQKKFLFATGIGNLRSLWKDKNAANRRQMEADFDQTRPDVCPLFNFPTKGDEDELILDALRQAMRKCTVDNPGSRPTSANVLLQLSNLLN